MATKRQPSKRTRTTRKVRTLDLIVRVSQRKGHTLDRDEACMDADLATNIVNIACEVTRTRGARLMGACWWLTGVCPLSVRCLRYSRNAASRLSVSVV